VLFASAGQSLFTPLQLSATTAHRIRLGHELNAPIEALALDEA
jgi:hypothetical protein